MTLLLIAAYVGGAWVCLRHRDVSPHLARVAGGFLGLALVWGFDLATRFGPLGASPAAFALRVGANLGGAVSAVFLALGLRTTLVDVRGRLAAAGEEAPHDRA